MIWRLTTGVGGLFGWYRHQHDARRAALVWLRKHGHTGFRLVWPAEPTETRHGREFALSVVVDGETRPAGLSIVEVKR